LTRQWNIGWNSQRNIGWDSQWNIGWDGQWNSPWNSLWQWVKQWLGHLMLQVMGPLPAEDALVLLWSLMKGAIALHSETFQSLHGRPHSLMAALTIVFFAGLSQSLSQLVVLFINQVKPLRFVLSLVISALFFVVGYGFWALSTWAIINLTFDSSLSFAGVLRTLGFSYTPLMLFGVLVVMPYFGGAIFVVLSIWTLLGVVVGIEAITPLSRWDAFESAALGWIVLQLLQQTVGQPIASLGQWIANWVAGEELITNRVRLAEELYVGLRTPRTVMDNPFDPLKGTDMWKSAVAQLNTAAQHDPLDSPEAGLPEGSSETSLSPVPPLTGPPDQTD
jgi:hypothetical protein